MMMNATKWTLRFGNSATVKGFVQCGGALENAKRRARKLLGIEHVDLVEIFCVDPRVPGEPDSYSLVRSVELVTR